MTKQEQIFFNENEENHKDILFGLDIFDKIAAILAAQEYNNN
jgi:hypothetical protein